MSLSLSLESTRATMWTNSEDMALSELSKKYRVSPLTRGMDSGQIHGDTEWNGGCQGLRGGAWGVTVSRAEFQFCKMKSVVKRMEVMVAPECESI